MENPTDFLKMLKGLADIGIVVPLGIIVRYLVDWIKEDACLSSRRVWWVIFGVSCVFALAATFALPEVQPELFKRFVWWVMLCKSLFNAVAIMVVAVAAHQYLKGKKPEPTPEP